MATGAPVGVSTRLPEEVTEGEDEGENAARLFHSTEDFRLSCSGSYDGACVPLISVLSAVPSSLELDKSSHHPFILHRVRAFAVKVLAANPPAGTV